MAKPFKNAGKICTVLSIIALLGAFIGIKLSLPLITIVALLPTIAYEVYRTEGKSTKWASRGLFITFIAELFFIYKDINFDLAQYLGRSNEFVKGYKVPLGDIKVVAPAIMAILAILLFKRTRGRYTKWLALIIFIGAFAIVYSLDPAIFDAYLKIGVNEALDQLN